jgi:hypothetical protein
MASRFMMSRHIDETYFAIGRTSWSDATSLVPCGVMDGEDFDRLSGSPIKNIIRIPEQGS